MFKKWMQVRYIRRLNSNELIIMKYVMFVAILLISLFTRIGLCEESLIAAEERGKLDRIINNHTYKLLIAKRTITLKNGSFKDREKPENYLNASLVKYTVVDLNEDGKLDGMVIIEHHSLGSGSFYEISGLINKDGQYVQTQPILLGDNIQIKDIRSTNSYPWAPKEIEVTILAHNESDSHAKPTLEETHYYSLEGNELKECKHIDICILLKKNQLISRFIQKEKSFRAFLCTKINGISLQINQD